MAKSVRTDGGLFSSRLAGCEKKSFSYSQSVRTDGGLFSSRLAGRILGPRKGLIPRFCPSVNEAPRSKAPRYLCEILRSPSTLLRQGYGGFTSPSSSQQAARDSAKENKKSEERR